MKRLILITMVVLMSSSIAMAQNFCKGDFNYNGSVAAEDVEIFLEHFGRSQFNNPCPPDGPAPVAKTGQTTEFTPGDDGYFEKGIEWPTPRFTDNEDGTVTDNLTGLMWLKDANCFGVRNWWEAITDCNGLGNGQCGLADGSSPEHWRLPNLSEIESLRDLQFYEPALSNSVGTGQWTHGDPFINLLTDSLYWSSSTSVYNAPNAVWRFSMYSGNVGSALKSQNLHVWCVRGGH